MQENNQNSSIQILLVICAGIVACVGLGWFILDRGNDVGTAKPAAPTAAPLTAIDVVDDDSEALEVDTTEADLRKARLAAEADILTEPENQSALYFYGRVLEKDPNHEVAKAELDAVLSRLSTTAQDLLDAEDYARAYALALTVATVRADHALVNDVQQTLDQLSGDLVTEAMNFAEAGDEQSAARALARAGSLPGRNRNYIDAVRDSMNDLLEAKREADAKREEGEQLARARATREWMEQIRGAIADGRLIEPAGDNAGEFIRARTADDQFSTQIRQEFSSALLAQAAANVETGDLDRADRLLLVAADFGAATDEVAQLRASLDRAYIDRESSKVMPLTDLIRVNTVPARYPRRAEERGISGWVQVMFTVMPTGETADIVVADAEPEQVFDEPAVEAVEQWTFEPREFRGQVIAQRASAKLVFRIQ